jgi:(1->4)-alpha-D-glucan 1-alpha-D-glucosylmutase
VALCLHFPHMVTGARARIPLATYRLQFNSAFTFADAQIIVDYLHALGISDCYASSYLKAVPGSPHGYDVADPTQLNPDIGDESTYTRWIAALQARGMGHILDLVPNHMGIAKSANPWWTDVLENGPSSRFARFFDIEWHPVKDELAEKVLIPILGDQYGEVLERQELTLKYGDGTFVVHYYDERLPIAPDTVPMIFDEELDGWLRDHGGDDAEELQSILTAGRNLPPRTTRDADEIAIRAREKEVVKRRLAALTERSADVARLIADRLARVNGTAGEPRSFDALDRLLNEQSYRLAHWRVASEEINYRRFFDVNQLAALRMEDPAVFEEVHRFAFELVQRRAATGLRVDHVDGLYSPGDYLQRLQARAGDVLDSAADHPIFLVVEKILGADEQLPPEWPVHGTTGYEFAFVVNNLFVDRRNERALDDLYARFIRRERESFDDIVYRSKKQAMHETMSGDINSLGHQLNRFSERNRHFRDFTLYSLISTLKEVIACFPVYRTYISPAEPVTEHDRRYVTEAIRCAKRRAPTFATLLFDFVAKLLLKETRVALSDECEARARIIGKFQQITSPVAAKGIEDAALYIYNRLLSLNEVGGDPTRFGLEPAQVHDWMARRQRTWPFAMSTTATHDTKRGEDVRARINVLSEIPGAWKAAVTRWRTLNRRYKTDVGGHLAPGANEEYLLYQTLVGVWPFEDRAADRAALRDRVVAYMTKALREAKVHTSWVRPDEAYEKAVGRFVDAILDRQRPNPFLQAFLPFQKRVAELGIYNSLAQLLIKVTAPGVPDFYQGTELWDLSLVDPDNRRPVDYRERADSLDRLGARVAVDELFATRVDGRIKQFTIARALATRCRERELYEQGEYVPLEIAGGRRECLFAFAKRLGDRMVITCVPRLIATLTPDASAPPLGTVWGDTRILLPGTAAAYTNAFTGTTVTTEGEEGARTLAAATVFDSFPVALLVPTAR